MVVGLEIMVRRHHVAPGLASARKRTEVQDRFGNWDSTDHQLAHDYKKPIEFIERGLEACRRSHVSESYFVDRYLKEDKTIEQNMLVADAYKDLMKEHNVYGAYTL